jgi:hypothetical protein
MIPKGLFSQLAMVFISIAIVITYVQPTFEEIAEIQDSMSTYELERDKVIVVNSQLADLEATLSQVSNDDEKRLMVYLPNSIDEIAVLRDIETITNNAGALYKEVSFAGAFAPPESDDNESSSIPATMYAFDLVVEGTYDQIKELFALLDQNAYPLISQSVAMQPLEGSFLTANIRLVTAAYNDDLDSTVGEEEIIF